MGDFAVKLGLLRSFLGSGALLAWEISRLCMKSIM